MVKKIIILLPLVLAYQAAYSAKAICYAKNLQTGQIYKAMVGERSYSTAVKSSQKQALIDCISKAKNPKLCRLTACYQR